VSILVISVYFMAEKKEHEDKGAETDLTKYELGYHLVPSLGEDDLALRVKDLHQAIVDAGGTVIKDGHPVPFVLAYTMSKLRAGKWENYDSSYFGWVRFEAPPEAIAEVKEVLDHADVMIRYLVIKLEEEALVVPVPVVRKVESGEVSVEPKALVKRVDEEVKAEVSEEELDKQIEQLIS
jgi:ribosomal protein S6